MDTWATRSYEGIKDAAGRVSDHWWDTYRARQLETKEATHEMRNVAKKGQKVVGRGRTEKRTGPS